MWKLDFDKKAKEIRKYPEPSWKGEIPIEEAVERLLITPCEMLLKGQLAPLSKPAV